MRVEGGERAWRMRSGGSGGRRREVGGGVKEDAGGLAEDFRERSAR